MRLTEMLKEGKKLVSELGCGDPTLGCRELWMTAFIQ